MNRPSNQRTHLLLHLILNCYWPQDPFKLVFHDNQQDNVELAKTTKKGTKRTQNSRFSTSFSDQPSILKMQSISNFKT